MQCSLSGQVQVIPRPNGYQFVVPFESKLCAVSMNIKPHVEEHRRAHTHQSRPARCQECEHLGFRDAGAKLPMGGGGSLQAGTTQFP